MSRFSFPHPLLVLAAVLFVACQESPVAPPATRPALGARLVERTFDVTTIDVPGALSTLATDINAGGDIVGTYIDASHHSHGYLLHDGDFTTLDFPGSAFTEAWGIGPAGEIVGDYRFAGEPAVNFHGYMRTNDGAFVPVNYPGHTNTIVQRILPDGTMLGCRHDGDLMASMRGVTISGQGSAEIAVFASMNTGSTPDGRRVVGFYTNMEANRVEGFLMDDGEFTALFVPGSTLTRVLDINPRGEIIGNYISSAGVFHGFVLNNEGYVSLDVPGAVATRVFGINPGGDIVGTYISTDGKPHGFLTRLAQDN